MQVVSFIHLEVRSKLDRSQKARTNQDTRRSV